MASLTYSCLFAKNYDTKKKTWRDGVLTAQSTLRFVRVTLYEVNELNRVMSTPLDAFDLFNYKYDGLAGEIVSSARFVIRIFEVKRNMKNSMIPQRLKVSRTPALLGNNDRQRTPALGTCRAFTKYRLSDGGATNSPAPVYNNARKSGGKTSYGQASENFNANRYTYLKQTDSSQIQKYPPSPVNSTRNATYKANNHGFANSAVQSPYKSGETRGSFSTKTYNRGEFTNSMPTLSPTKTHDRTSNSLEQVKQQHIMSSNQHGTVIPLSSPPKQAQGGTSIEAAKAVAATPIASGDMTTGTTNFDGIICDGMLEDLMKTTEKEAKPAVENDPATIVDSTLIDCIESALDHFGELKCDM